MACDVSNSLDASGRDGWYRYMSPGHHPQRCISYATLRLSGPAVRKITSRGSALSSQFLLGQVAVPVQANPGLQEA